MGTGGGDIRLLIRDKKREGDEAKKAKKTEGMEKKK